MPEHEDQCDHVAEVCQQCGDEVPRKERSKHDCVASMLGKYKLKSSELSEISSKVDSLALDINKQTTILDRLN